MPTVEGVEIQLQDADTENLADTEISQNNPDDVVGLTTSNRMKMSGTSERTHAARFILPTLPANTTFQSAEYCGYVKDNSLDTVDNDVINVSIHHIYSFPLYNITNGTGLQREWEEGVCSTGGGGCDNSDNNGFMMNWTNRPQTSSQYNLTPIEEKQFDGNQAEDVWICFDFSNPVSLEYSEGDENVSLFFIIEKISGSLSDDGLSFASKEDSTVANRVYLNITYDFDIKPKHFSNQSSIPTKYSPSTKSFFNITWNITAFGIDTVLFESNYSGSDVNYTMSNLSGQVFGYNETLPAGNFYWRSHANSTQGAINSTEKVLFNVGKADNICHINVTDTETTTDSNVNVETTAIVTSQAYCDSGIQTLYYDGSPVSNPHITTHGAGAHTYISNSSGDDNYSTNSSGINITLVSTQPTGGGGGGGGTIIVVQQTATNFTATTLTGGKGYQLFMLPGQTRNTDIIIRNTGESTLTLFFFCEGDCDFLDITVTQSFSVEPGEEILLPATYTVPETATFGDRFVFVLRFEGSEENQGEVNVRNVISVNRFAELFNVLQKVNPFRDEGRFNLFGIEKFPKLIVYLFVSTGIIFLVGLAFGNSKRDGLKNFVRGVAVIGVFAMMLLLDQAIFGV